MTDDIQQEQERGALTGGLEIRAFQPTVELRASEDDAPGIVGYGSVSNQSTTIEGFFSDWDEEVAPGAWAKTISESTRILSMFNHDPGRLLGSTDAGTLSLSEDDAGLLYDVDINPDDPMAMSAHAQVARGDVAGSSVWFRVVRQEFTQPTDDNGLERPLRRILEATLFETGPVTMPAFDTTTAAARTAHRLDSMLRASGMSAEHRSRLTVASLAGEVDGPRVDEFRTFLARRPELREAVCDCKLSEQHRAATEVAPGVGTPPPEGHLPSGALTLARARDLELLRLLRSHAA